MANSLVMVMVMVMVMKAALPLVSCPKLNSAPCGSPMQSAWFGEARACATVIGL